jgi:hypothetical protein
VSKNTSSIVRTRNQMVLTDEDKMQIRAVIQQLYYENSGEFPSAQVIYEKLHRTYPLEKVEEVLNDPEDVAKLEKAGVKSLAPVGGVLTPTQILVANKIFNFQDKDSIRMFLEGIGVTTAQYYAWLRDPVFVEHLNKRASDLYKDADHIAYRQLVRAMEAGDMSSVKMFLEMKGKYAKNINMNVNVEAMMANIVEIVVKHVQDPDVLDAIAKDFEELDG